MFGDALGEPGQATLEMHLEAVMVQRGGHNRESLEIQFEAVIDTV
jgi:hypothetical protein